MKSSPIDNLTCDVIAVLHDKVKALEAYDKYLADAEDDDELQGIFRAMRRQDEELVRILTERLARRLDDRLGYEQEGEADEEEAAWDEGDVDEDDVDEIASAIAGAEEAGEDVEEAEEEEVEAGREQRAEEGDEGQEAADGGVFGSLEADSPPPRRGESTHRR